MRPWTNKSLGLGILGLFLVALGISLCFLWPIFFHHILQKELALSPTSHTYELWSDTSKISAPMIFEIFFFNWTNPEQLGKQKPHLEQLGPYTFREVRQKTNITFHHENKTVSYFQRRSWYFDAERTNGSLTDIVGQLDAVSASAAHKVRYWDFEWQKSLSYLLAGRKTYIHKTVDELLFTGYPDTLLSMGKMIADPDIPTFDRFGWFYMRNGSNTFDGHFNVETGENDISQLGITRKWNYRDTVKYLKSPCNVIEGSGGEFWPPYRTKDHGISLFSADLCRELFYEYEATTSHFGIEGYRYSIDKKTLGNATKRRYPHDQAKFFEPTTTTEDFFVADTAMSDITTSTTESAYKNGHSSEQNSDEYPDDDPDVINMGNCYCNGECTPSGLLNMTSCRYGAPIFISLPHFHKADPILLDAVEGLRPDDKEHSFSITLEPTTGIPLVVQAVFQANLHLHSSEFVALFQNVPDIYFPMLWFRIRVEVPAELASSLRILLAIPTVMLCSGIVMTIVGLFLIACVAVLLYLGKKRRIPPIDATMEKMIDTPEKKTEMVYMDKVSNNEDKNIKTDRCLIAKH